MAIIQQIVSNDALVFPVNDRISTSEPLQAVCEVDTAF